MPQSVELHSVTTTEAVTRVAVVGLGYIGLPTAACLATGGLQVTGVDLSEDIVEQVSRGEAPFAEPDLSIAVSGAVAMGRLSASTEVPPADAYIIAVPTPFTAGHQPDLTAVTAAAEAIAPPAARRRDHRAGVHLPAGHHPAGQRAHRRAAPGPADCRTSPASSPTCTSRTARNGCCRAAS